MCLGVPMRLVSKDGHAGRAELDGVTREVMLDLVPDVEVGQFVVIHAGYAISVLDEAGARETLSLLADALGSR